MYVGSGLLWPQKKKSKTTFGMQYVAHLMPNAVFVLALGFGEGPNSALTSPLFTVRHHKTVHLSTADFGGLRLSTIALLSVSTETKHDFWVNKAPSEPNTKRSI